MQLTVSNQSIKPLYYILDNTTYVSINFNVTGCDDGGQYECSVMAWPSNDTGTHMELLEVDNCEYHRHIQLLLHTTN